MTDPRGALKVTAGGNEYTLWLGMSVLADLQDKHGNDVLNQVDAPADAGANWLPPLRIVVDLLLGALQRYHPDADKYTVDEIMADAPDVFERLMAAAFPDPQGGNAKRPKRAA